MAAVGKLKPLIDECKRQYDNCLYTSTALFEYVKFLRCIRVTTVIVPLVLGSLAGWSVLNAYDDKEVRVFTAACAFIAGLVPSIMSALKFDESLDRCKTLANEFSNLKDRFRQAAEITAHKGVAELEATFNQLREQLEALRKNGVAIPDRFFRRAQQKVNAGDYNFDVDAEAIEKEQGAK
jgi:hypothetical protein